MSDGASPRSWDATLEELAPNLDIVRSDSWDYRRWATVRAADGTTTTLVFDFGLLQTDVSAGHLRSLDPATQRAALARVLDRFRGDAIPVSSSGNALRFRSSLAAPAEPAELRAAWAERPLPAELEAFWELCGQARFFEDQDYGQWGFHLLDPQASAARTRAEQTRAALRPDDIVVGEFLGDQELLIFAPSEAASRRLVVLLPLYERSEWFGAAGSLADFLEKLFEAGGDKFWEADR